MNGLLTSVMRVVALAAPRTSAFVLRDQFAGSVNPLVTGGARTVTGTRWKLLDGWLRGGTQTTSVAWGNSEIVYSGIARAAGRVLAIDFIMQDSSADLALGFASSNDFTDPRTQGHGLIVENGDLGVATPGVKTVIDEAGFAVRPMHYGVYVVLGSRGAALLLTSFGADTGRGMTFVPGIPQYPNARVVWWEDADTTATLYPYISALDDLDEYLNGHAVGGVTVFDVPLWTRDGTVRHFIDRFSTLESAWVAKNSSTWTLDSGRLYASAGSGSRVIRNNDVTLSDGIFQFDFTTPASGSIFGGMAFRFASDTDYLVVGTWAGNGAGLTVQRWVNHAFSSTRVNQSYTFNYNTTYRVTIGVQGDKYLFAVNGVVLNSGNWQTDAGAFNTSASGVGFAVGGAQAADHRFDNLVVMPPTVDLTGLFPSGTPAPRVFTTGATLASDTFTDDNDTALDAHTAESGGAWTEHAGTWTIQSNALEVTGTNGVELFATQEIAADVEAEVTINLGAFTRATDRMRPGIIVRWVDASHYVVVRTFIDSGQLNTDEIEVIVADGGAAIEHKVALGNTGYFQPSTAYTLRVQVVDELLHVFLEDIPTISFVIPSTLLTGTRVGLYDEKDDNNVALSFDNWTVKALF